jgi:hypothetical protein
VTAKERLHVLLLRKEIRLTAVRAHFDPMFHPQGALIGTLLITSPN